MQFENLEIKIHLRHFKTQNYGVVGRVWFSQHRSPEFYNRKNFNSKIKHIYRYFKQQITESPTLDNVEG